MWCTELLVATNATFSIPPAIDRTSGSAFLLPSTRNHAARSRKLIDGASTTDVRRCTSKRVYGDPHASLQHHVARSPGPRAASRKCPFSGHPMCPRGDSPILLDSETKSTITYFALGGKRRVVREFEASTTQFDIQRNGFEIIHSRTYFLTCKALNRNATLLGYIVVRWR